MPHRRPTRPPVLAQPKPGIIHPTAKGERKAFAAGTMEFATPGLIFRPQHFNQGDMDLRNAPFLPPGVQKKHDAETPVVIRLESYGAQGTSGGVVAYSSAGNPGPGWSYTQTPPTAKYRGGTAKGGLIMLPPEVGMEDYATTFAPPGITKSTCYFVAGPGVYFGAGTPELTNGGVAQGYSWGIDTTTWDLVFRSHDIAEAFDKVKFTSDGDLAFKSAVSFWGTLHHTNTADRTYTFPDQDGTVALTSDIGELNAYKTANESVTNSTTLQADNHLTLTLAASTNYQFRFWIPWTTAGTAGIRLALNGTVGVTSLKADIKIADLSTNAYVAWDRVTALSSAVTSGALGGTNVAEIEGTIETSTAGTFRLEWAQDTADAVNATTVQRNASLTTVAF